MPRQEVVAAWKDSERLTSQVGLYCFHQIRREFDGHELVGKAVDPYGVEHLGHACERLLGKVPGNSFNESGQLCLCMKPNFSSRSIPRPLISFRILPSRIFSKNLLIVSEGLMGR